MNLLITYFTITFRYFAKKRYNVYKECAMIEYDDRIVYPMYGAGIVKDIKFRDFFGEKMKFCVLEIKAKSLTVMFPLKKADELNIRDLSDMSTIMSSFDVSKNKEYTIMSNWNKRYRENLEKLRTGSIQDITDVIVNLHGIEKSKGLSSLERKLYHSSFEILASEIVLIEDMIYNDALKMIKDIVNE